MRFSLAVLLVGVAALCALQPGWAKPHVMAAGGGTMLVVREVEQESTDVDVVRRVAVGEVRDEDNDVLATDDQADETELDDAGGFVVELDVDVEDADMPTTPRPPPRCHLRWCWKSCTKRGYNWGLCLCKKCHCYY
ncbi:uncharacterized protein LOC117647021 [Thrips palmi]|uniref:Uncharacterized protein LOC117647021 n=1 Tax=Thrips palmi TaxID=161013 RepID=A0A6P8ZPN1_THRPL|nr:uncharacterized protein LOC117647021 [Thrips palmi]XP_034244394.1 uncharacterized protein LOC117647021 [Thrips palmi]